VQARPLSCRPWQALFGARLPHQCPAIKQANHHPRDGIGLQDQGRDKRTSLHDETPRGLVPRCFTGNTASTPAVPCGTPNSPLPSQTSSGRCRLAKRARPRPRQFIPPCPPGSQHRQQMRARWPERPLVSGSRTACSWPTGAEPSNCCGAPPKRRQTIRQFSFFFRPAQNDPGLPLALCLRKTAHCPS
jgi:hypothetical protein